MTARAHGADFSSWQDNQHFAAAIGVGLDFAFVKLTEGTGYTYQAARNRLEQLRAHGIRCGVYHFLTPGDGAAQWRHFAAVLEQLPFRGELLICLDYEAAGTSDADARAFIRAGRRDGWKVGLYGSEGGHGYAAVGAAWRWIASWRKAPPPRRGWSFWQFAPGRGGDPDWNVFNGPPAALAAFWARNAGPGRYHVRFPASGALSARLGPFWTKRAAARAALRYAVRHPRLRSYRVDRA